MFKKLLRVLFFFTFSNIAFAHPVSFKEGIAVMPSFMEDRQELEINYSLTDSYALGTSYHRLEGERQTTTLGLARFNYKAYRRNAPSSQANLYLTTGIGGSLRDDPAGLTGLLGLQADYETRRIYTLFYGERIESEKDDDFYLLRYRAGFAPYLAAFDEVSTWLIVQTDYMNHTRDKFSVTPLLRFFYLNYLVEVGVSLEGNVMANGIFHF